MNALNIINRFLDRVLPTLALLLLCLQVGQTQTTPTWNISGNNGYSTEYLCRANTGSMEFVLFPSSTVFITGLAKSDAPASLASMTYGVKYNSATTKIDLIENGAITSSVIRTVSATDKIKLERNGSVISVYLTIASVYTKIGYFNSDANLNYKVFSIKPAAAANFSGLSLTVSNTWLAGCNSTNTPSTDATLNWQHVKLYDAGQNGLQMSGESRSYMNKTGATTQSQTYVPAAQTILAAEQVYDAHGRPALSTLPAPTTNTAIQYVPNLIQNSSNTYYDYRKFDEGTKINTPDPVGTAAGTVGAFYSGGAASEPYVATTQYPYSRVEYSIDGSVKRASGIGENFRMGSGKEVRSFTLNAGSELAYVFGGRRSFEVTVPPATPLAPLQKSMNQAIIAVKNITINQDGTELIQYSSMGGQLIASCVSGQQPACSQMARYKLYDNKDVSALNEYGTNSVKLHIPAAKLGDAGTVPAFKIFPDQGYLIKQNVPGGGNPSSYFDFELFDLNTNQLLVAGTDYTITFDNAAPNWFFKVFLSAAYRNAAKSVFLKVSFAYTDAYNGPNGVYTQLFVPGYEPPVTITNELDYSNWTLNFYDAKGQLRMNIPPSGIDCTSQTAANFNYEKFSAYMDFYTVAIDGNGFKTYNYNTTNLPIATTAITTPAGFASELKVKLRLLSKPGIIPDLYDADLVSVKFNNNADMFDRAAPASPTKPIGGGSSTTSRMSEADFNLRFNPLTADSIGLGAINTTEHLRQNGSGSAINSEQSRNGKQDIAERMTDQGWVDGNDDGVPCKDLPVFLVAFKVKVKMLNASGTQMGSDQYLYKAFGTDCHNLLVEMENPDGPKELESVLDGTNTSSITTKVTEVLVRESETGTYIAFNASTPSHRLIRYILIKYDAELERYKQVSAPQNMATIYHYDDLGRLIASLDPDRGKTEYIYDDEGKLRFSQDAVQRALGVSGGQSAFSYTDYDNYGRVIESGEYYRANNAVPPPYKFVDNYYVAPNCISANRNLSCPEQKDLRNGAGISFGGADKRNVSNFVYDYLSSTIYNLPGGITLSNYTPVFAEGSIALSYNANHRTWYKYNHRGEIVASVQTFPAAYVEPLGVTFDYEYDFFGNLKRAVYQKGIAAEQFEHAYTYDGAGRLLYAETSKGTSAISNERLLHNTSSFYKTGALKRSELGNRLQGIDYVYTIDGRLKCFNNTLLGASDPGGDGYAGANSAVKPDIFALSLDYFPTDYVRAGTNISYGANEGAGNYRYDGRVKSARWNLRNGTIQAPANQENMYKYNYDWQQRLTSAEFGLFTPGTTTNNSAGNGGYGAPAYGTFAPNANNFYKEDNITYDLNGNIKTLRRYGNSGTAPIDNITSYNLISNSNRLAEVVETAGDAAGIDDVLPQAAGNYLYNENGAIIKDVANDLSALYNNDGLVTDVKNATGTTLKVSYKYDEYGNRIMKDEMTAGVSTRTLYLREPGGGSFATFQSDNAAAFVRKEIFLGGGALGTLFEQGADKYTYALKDHLGNVRATLNRELVSNAVQILSYNDYYSWGMSMPGRTGASSPAYRMGYQGQELENKTGMYGFGLRFYDQRLGRWFSPDPYGQHFSPYLAMSNNPVSFVDPDGGRDSWWDRSGISVYVDGFLAIGGSEYANAGLGSDFSTDYQGYWGRTMKGAGRFLTVGTYYDAADGAFGTSIGKLERRSDCTICEDGIEYKWIGYAFLSTPLTTRDLLRDGRNNGGPDDPPGKTQGKKDPGYYLLAPFFRVGSDISDAIWGNSQQVRQEGVTNLAGRIPGYLALNTFSRHLNGEDVSGWQWFWATVDYAGSFAAPALSQLSFAAGARASSRLGVGQAFEANQGKTLSFAAKREPFLKQQGGFGAMMDATESARYSEFWSGYSPKQITPGTVRVDWLRISGRTGRLESSRVIYDPFGRQTFRIDFSDHMRPLDHSIPHLHQYEYSPIFRDGRETLFNFWNK